LASRPAGLDAACGQPGTWLRQPECRQGIAPEQGAKAERRQKGKLKVGLSHVQGRWRPLFFTAIFCGLRASESAGLALAGRGPFQGELHVRQRADRYHKIGPPNSEAGERTVPVPPVLNALREWKLKCPKGKFSLVFANLSGNIESHGNIIAREFEPVQVAAGVTVDGKAKYTGLHSLRHFFASWCINRRQDGGLELPLKVVQERLGIHP
jgi:integrase